MSEYYDLVQELVTKAWLVLDKFDSERANFTTFIYKVFFIRIYEISRARRAKKRYHGGMVSLDNDIPDCEELVLMDRIEDLSKKSALEEMIEAEYFESITKLLKPITLEYIYGMKQRELAEKYNISQSYVSRVVRQDIKKAKKELERINSI